jgi:hypothetical protein
LGNDCALKGTRKSTNGRHDSGGPKGVNLPSSGSITNQADKWREQHELDRPT